MILGLTSNDAGQHFKVMAHAPYVGDNKVLCRVLGKFKLYIDSRDVSMLPALAQDGCLNLPVTEWLCGITQRGMVAVNVGSSVGYFAILLSELVGSTGRVFAFEPHPGAHHSLKDNLEMNGFHWCRAYPMAVSDGTGTGEMILHRRRLSAATMNELAKREYGEAARRIAVQTCTLDNVMEQNRVLPDVMLIEAEGFEPEVWTGMKRILQAKRKIHIIIEFIPRLYAKPEAFLERIRAEGFSVNRFSYDGVISVSNEELLDDGRHSSARHLYLSR